MLSRIAAPGRAPRQTSGPRWPAAWTPLIYLAVSFAYFGLPLMPHPGRAYIGSLGYDSEIFIWAFAWWPHAILHGTNPFLTHAIWAPSGLNLAWTTTVPGLALLFAPVTLLAGPVVAYNTAAVVLPALAAWSAYALCRYVTGAFWPSLAGGYLFGFSSYMLGHEQGHLHLTAVFPVPLVALVVLRYLDRKLDGWGLAWRLGALIAAQLSFSQEVAFTLTLALVTALLIAFAVVPSRRPRLRSLLGPLCGAYALAGALASPLLYYMLSRYESGSISPPQLYWADVLSPFVPTGLVAAGGHWTAATAAKLGTNTFETGAYLGVPTLAVVALFASRWRARPGGRFLVLVFGVAAFASLGLALRVDRHRLIPLPSTLLAQLPLFENVLPNRLSMYTALAAAVMVAMWAASSAPLWLRRTLPALAVLALVPALGSGHWKTTPPQPPLFDTARYRGCLQGQTVLVIPYNDNGNSLLWQAESDFRFKLAEGYVTPRFPRSYVSFPIFSYLERGPRLLPDPHTYGWLSSFVRAKGVTEIVVDDSDPNGWSAFLGAKIPPQHVGGVSVYAVGAPSSCHPSAAGQDARLSHE